MNCERFQEELDEYVAGGPGAGVRQEIRGQMDLHLAACQGCREVTEAFRSLLGSLPANPPALSVDFTDRVMRDVRQAAGLRQRNLRFRLVTWTAAAVAAAAALAMAVLWNPPAKSTRPGSEAETVRVEPGEKQSKDQADPGNREQPREQPVASKDPIAPKYEVAALPNPAPVEEYAGKVGRSLKETLAAVAPPAAASVVLPTDWMDVKSPAPEDLPALDALGQDGLGLVKVSVGLTRETAGGMVGFVMRQGKMFDVNGKM